MILTIPASQVRANDIVLKEDGTKDFAVRHAMTTGKKARLTTLAPWGMEDPRHYGPDTQLTVRRADAEADAQLAEEYVTRTHMHDWTQNERRQELAHELELPGGWNSREAYLAARDIAGMDVIQ